MLKAIPHQLARLDFGVFIVASSSHSGRKHGIHVAYVPRVGPTLHEDPWFWTTSGCPAEVVRAVMLRGEAFTTDAILTHYGIEEDLAQ
jgi:hypothetical protein